jgi:hypothetical protein
VVARDGIDTPPPAFQGHLAMELSGLESADVFDAISVTPHRFRMVWDSLGWFRPYDGRVLVASTPKLWFQASSLEPTHSKRDASNLLGRESTRVGPNRGSSAQSASIARDQSCKGTQIGTTA